MPATNALKDCRYSGLIHIPAVLRSMDITLHWSLPLVFLSVTGLVLALAKLIPSPDSRVNDRIRNFQGISGGERLASREEERPQ